MFYHILSCFIMFCTIQKIWSGFFGFEGPVAKEGSVHLRLAMQRSHQAWTDVDSPNLPKLEQLQLNLNDLKWNVITILTLGWGHHKTVHSSVWSFADWRLTPD
jgi:hypothetical protein